MSTKVATLYADIVANVGNFLSGLAQAREGLEDTSSDIGSTIKTLGALGVAAGVVGTALTTAFELGTEGAQITAVQSSFDNLTSSLGAAPNILNTLQDATKGTVSELDLMNSVNTLLIGTTGDLGTALMQSAPQLAEIAQAAHEVNPALGDTTFLFDSLARGIKRASPLILDNLGIIVKLDEEYRAYAATLGKTSNQLTAEEKSMAVLNAVLREGTTIVDQAQNVNSGYVNSIDRMNAAIDDAHNALATKFAPAVASAAEFTTYLLTGTNSSIDAFKREQAAVGATATSYEEYLDAKRDAIKTDGVYINNQGMLVNAAGRVLDANYATVESYQALRAGMSAVLDGGLSMLGQTLPEITQDTYDQDAAMAAYGDRLSGMAGYYAELNAAEQNRITTAGLMAGLQGNLTAATESYSQTLSQLTEQESLITQALADAAARGYAPTSEKVQELNAALLANQEAQAGALSGLQTVTAEMLYQQAAAGLDAQSALDLARNMGVLNEADYTVASSMQALREEFFNANTGMLEAGASAADFVNQATAITKAVQNLQAKNVPVTFDAIQKELEAMAKADASSEIEGVGTASSEATPGMEDVAAATADAAESMGDASDTSGEEAGALDDIKEAAGPASKGIEAAGRAASNSVRGLRDAARAAGDLASELSGIDGRTTITVSTSGIESAISDLQRLQEAISAITTQITINASVQSNQPVTYSPTVSSEVLPSTTIASGPVTEVYNVYDPLAAVMLVSAKRAATVNKLEALMNG